MKRSSAGFSLVELMVATVIMAIGLIGTVAMQATAKQNGVDSSQRSIAVTLANDIISRMQMNKSQLAIYAAGEYGENEVYSADFCNYKLGDLAVCTPTQIANFDQMEWNSLLNGQRTVGQNILKVSAMIKPKGCIDYDANTGLVTVVISWLGRKEIDSQIAAAEDPTTLEATKDTCGKTLLSGKLQRRRQVAMQTFIY